MFVDGWWKAPIEPPPRPASPTRQERVFLWLVGLNLVLLLLAPVGGASLVHAVLAAVRGG